MNLKLEHVTRYVQVEMPGENSDRVWNAQVVYEQKYIWVANDFNWNEISLNLRYCSYVKNRVQQHMKNRVFG